MGTRKAVAHGVRKGAVRIRGINSPVSQGTEYLIDRVVVLREIELGNGVGQSAA